MRWVGLKQRQDDSVSQTMVTALQTATQACPVRRSEAVILAGADQGKNDLVVGEKLVMWKRQ